MRRMFAALIAATLLTTGCSSNPPPVAAGPTSAVPPQSPAVDVEALVAAAMIPGDSLTNVGGPAKPGWPDKLGAGWVSFICRQPVGTADLGRQASFTRTWVDPDEWFVQVSVYAWKRHSGAQMLDRLRNATASCTEPFALGQQLVAFTPEIKLPAYPEVAGFAHCAKVNSGPDSKAEKNCYAYLAKGNVLTKVDLRDGGSGGLEETLRGIAAVAAQQLREVA